MGNSSEIDRIWPILSLIILLSLGAINILLPLFVIPKFEQIYQDAIPGMPLPGITVFVIVARCPLALIAMAWPVAGIIAVWQQHRAANWIINLGYLYFVSLIGITVIALFMPIGGNLIVAMPDAQLTSAASSR